MSEKATFVQRVTLRGFRGIQGEIEFGRGANIIIGPNSSGKTAVLEAVAHAVAFNYTDLRTSSGVLLIMHAARGSEKHSLASIMPFKSQVAEACITIGGREGCVVVEKKNRMESRGTFLVPVVDVVFRSKLRNCALAYSISPDNIGIKVGGDQCFSEEPGVTLGVLTPGILPYNFFDSLIGELKRRSPGFLGKLVIELNGHSYGIDVAADDWNSLSVYIIEGEDKLVSFYSIGRGLQRAFLLKTLLDTMNIVLIDEAESAMHPELLAKTATWIAEAVNKGKQVMLTTQSLEAARFIAAAVAGADEKDWWNMDRLREAINKICSGGAELNEKLSLIILRKRGDQIKAMRLTGCTAIRHLLSTSDARLTYTLL